MNGSRRRSGLDRHITERRNGARAARARTSTSHVQTAEKETGLKPGHFLTALLAVMLAATSLVLTPYAAGAQVAPTAGDDMTSVARGESVVIDVLLNDDGGQPLEPLTIIALPTAPASGVATITDRGTTITFDAPADFTGTSFTYEIENSQRGTATARVTVDATCGDILVAAAGGATALDAAILATNACPGPQTISIESGTYAQRLTFETITDDVTLIGDPATRPVIRIDVTGTYATTFRVDPGANVEFENLVFDDPGGFSCFICVESATVVVRNVQMNGSFPGRSEGAVAAIWARSSQLTIENSVINNSDSSAITGLDGTHVIATDTTITGSSGNGIVTDTLVGTRLQISGGGAGLNLSGEVTLDESYIWNNTGAGFKQGTRTTSTITNTVIGRDPDGNAGPNGIGVTAFGEMRMSNSVVANSVNQGIEVYPGYLAPASFTDVQVLDNGRSGLSISSATSADLTRVTISGNGAEGLYLLERPATIVDSSITANGTDCYFFRTTAVDGGGNADSDGSCGFVVPNDPPVAVADTATSGPGETIVIDVLANDFDPDVDAISIDSTTSVNATVAADGLTISYTAPAVFNGEEFDYTISDSIGETATAKVTVDLVCNDITVPHAAGDDGVLAAVAATNACPGPQTILLEGGLYLLYDWLRITDELTIAALDPKNPPLLDYRAQPSSELWIFYVDNPTGPFIARDLLVQATAPRALGFFRDVTVTMDRVLFRGKDIRSDCSVGIPPAVELLNADLVMTSSEILLASCDGLRIDAASSAEVNDSLIGGAASHGIRSSGMLVMRDSEIAENSGHGVTSLGAGSSTQVERSHIWGNGGHGLQSDGSAYVADSVIGLRPQGGTEAYGNAQIGIRSTGPLEVINTTIARNQEGIVRFGSDPGTITNSTIRNSRSTGLRNENSVPTTMTGTSLSQNSPNCVLNLAAGLTDGGGNSDDDGTCGTNTSPSAIDDTFRIDEDTPLVVPVPGVLGNDTDADGDPLTVELVSGPTYAQTFILQPTGTFGYIPIEHHAGTDEFTYRVTDGTFSAEATVTISIRAINDPPTIEVPDTQTATLGEATSITVLVADVDADDSELYGFDSTTPAIQLNVEHGMLDATAISGVVIAPPSGPVIAISGEIDALNKALATLTYTPDAGYLGPDTLTATVDDRSENGAGGVGLRATGSTLIMVVEQNDPPVPANESYETDEDTVLTVGAPGVLNNDLEPEGDDMTAILVTGTSSGLVELAPDGSFVYEPLPDFAGNDQFTYNVSDGVNLSIDATVSITVLPIDDDVRATATPASLTFDEDASGQITITLTDPDSPVGDVVVTTAVLDQTLASAVVQGTGESRTITVTGKPDAHGNTLLQIGYGHGSPSALLIVAVTITPVNDPPTILPIDDQSTNEDASFAFQIVIDDEETDVEHLVLTIETTIDDLATITRTLQSPGLNVVPLPDAFGDTTVTVTVSDGDAQASTTFDLAVVPVNDEPIGVPDSFATPEDTALKIGARAGGVLANDSDPNDGDPDGATLTAIGFSAPGHGSLVGQDDGTFSYEPDANFFGEDQFTYMASDGEDQSLPVTVTITVEPVDDPPTAEPDSYTTDEDSPLLVAPPGVLGNDADSDTPAAELRAVIDTGPATGQLTLAPGGGFTYHPELNLFGQVTFDYHVTDETTASAPVTVTIDVQPINDPPMLQAPASVETLEATPVSFDVLISDVESPVASLVLTAVVDDPTAGVVAVGEANPSGITQITFTPTAGPGPTVLTLSLLDDPTETPATATVTIDVVSPNRPPTAVLDVPAAVVEGVGDVALDAKASTDPDNDLLTYNFTPLAGLVDNGDGTATFNDTADDGVFTVEVEVCDPSDACDQAQSSIAVTNVAPTIILGGPRDGVATVAMMFPVTIIDPGDDEIALSVDWGDGSTVEQITIPAGDAADPLIHIFDNEGNYTVELRATDDDGGEAIVSAGIDVARSDIPVFTDGQVQLTVEWRPLNMNWTHPGGRQLRFASFGAERVVSLGANCTNPESVSCTLPIALPASGVSGYVIEVLDLDPTWSTTYSGGCARDPEATKSFWFHVEPAALHDCTVVHHEIGTVIGPNAVPVTITQVWNPGTAGDGVAQLEINGQAPDSDLFLHCGNPTLGETPVCMATTTYDPSIEPHLEIEPAADWTTAVSGDCTVQLIDQRLLVEIASLGGSIPTCALTHTWLGESPELSNGVVHVVLDWQPLNLPGWNEPGGTVIEFTDLATTVVLDVGEALGNLCPNVNQETVSPCQLTTTLPVSNDGFAVHAPNLDSTWVMELTGDCSIPISDPDAPGKAPGPSRLVVGLATIKTCTVTYVEIGVPIVLSTRPFTLEQVWAAADSGPGAPTIRINGHELDEDTFLGCGDPEQSSELSCVELLVYNSQQFPHADVVSADGWATTLTGDCTASAGLNGHLVFVVDEVPESIPRCTLTHTPLVGPPGEPASGFVDLTLVWEPNGQGGWTPPIGVVIDFVDPLGATVTVAIEDHTVAFPCPALMVLRCEGLVAIPPSSDAGYEIVAPLPGADWAIEFSHDCTIAPDTTKDHWFIVEPASLQACTITYRQLDFDPSTTAQPLEIRQLWNWHDVSSWGDPEIRIDGAEIDDEVFFGCGNPYVGRIPDCAAIVAYSPGSQPQLQVQPALNWITAISGDCVTTVTSQEFFAEVTPLLGAIPRCTLTHTWAGTVLSLSRGGKPFEKVWPGDVLDLRADNLQPGSLVSIFIGDVLVVTTTVDSRGSVDASVGPVPDLAPGNYLVVVRGPGVGGDETEETVEIEIEDPPEVRIRDIVQTVRELDPGAAPILPVEIELRDVQEVDVNIAVFNHPGAQAPEELDFGKRCDVDGESHIDVVFGDGYVDEGEPVRITLENGSNLLPLQFCHDDEQERTARLRIEVTDAETGELYVEGYVVILDDDLVTLNGPRELLEGGVKTNGSIPLSLPNSGVVAFWPPPQTTSTDHTFTYGVAPWAELLAVYLSGVSSGSGACESLIVPQPDLVLVNGFTGGVGTIVTCGDSIPELDRQVELVFVSDLGTERFPLTLVDDDFAPTFAEGQSASVAEPTFGQDPEPTTFTVDIEGPVDHPYQVRVTTQDVGGAVANPDGSCNGDVRLRDNLLTIPANATSVDVQLVICPAAVADADGVFHLAFSAPLPLPVLNPFFALPITILDRSLPDIGAAPVQADEDDGNVRVRFNVASPSASTLWARTMDGSAKAGSDYVGVGGLLTAAALDLDPGETGTVSIDIGLVDDAIDEGTESFTVEVWTAAIGGQHVATAHVTIVDDDAPPIIRGVDLVAVEPAGNLSTDSPTVQVQFEIDEPGAAISLWPRIVGGSATSSDYNWDDTPFDLAEGFVAPIGVTVIVINNGIPEPDETLEIALFDSFIGGNQVASATLTIQDEDREFPVLASPAPVAIIEDGDSATLTFDVLQSPSANVTLDVGWRPVSGNPTAGTCSFFGLGGSDDIGGGFGDFLVSTVREAVVVSVSGCPDNELEADKVIDVVITAPDGTELASTRVTMADDDDPPDLRLLDVTIQEGDPTGPLLNRNFNRVGTLLVQVIEPPERDYLVTLQPRPGDGSVSFGLACFPVPPFGAPDAIAGPFQTVTIPADTAPGSILQFDDVLACRNEDPDSTRSYEIEVVDGPGESGGVNDRAIVTIEDDDGAPPSDTRVSITNASVTEGNSGSRAVTVDVTVVPGEIPLGLTWATAAAAPSVGAAATPGSDYLAASGELFFGAQGGTQTVELTVLGDELVEGDEWFRVILTDDQDVAMSAEANVRIRDDEYIAIRVLDAPDVTEGDSGLRTMTFTVTASAEPPENATFYLGTHDAVDASLVPLDPGRASAGSDYNSKYATVTFGPGQPLSQEFTVSVRGDQTIENSEAIYIAVAAFGGPGYTSTTVERSNAVGIVRDDDAPPIITGPTLLQVTMGEPATTAPVVYPVTAQDNESNVVPVVCSPASGSQFAVGTHSATCTATDSSGNAATLTIRIVVSKGRGDRLIGIDGVATSQARQGSMLQVVANGYAAASVVSLELRSDPLDLGTATADGSGSVRAVVTVPRDAPLGQHTIAVIGQAPDGTPQQVLLSVEVGPRPVSVVQYPVQSTAGDPGDTGVSAPVPEPAAAARQPSGTTSPPSPSGPLAHTGAPAVGLLQLALMLLGTGCAVAAGSRRRRRGVAPVL